MLNSQGNTNENNSFAPVDCECGLTPVSYTHLNIYQATVEAMKMAVNSLKPRPDYLLIDAVKLTDIHIEQQSIIKGDTLSVSIAAASILAKVERDHTMEAFDSLYPGYGFARHKGYATKEHVQLLLQKGPCPIPVSYTHL